MDRHLLSALNARLEAWARDADPASVLDDQVLDETRQLLDTSVVDPDDPSFDLQAVHTVAMVRWLRCCVQADGPHARADLSAAIRLFTAVHAFDPSAVPQPVLDLLDRTGEPEADEAGAVTWQGLAATFLDRFSTANQRGDLRRAIELYDTALEAGIASGAERAAILTRLASALLVWYEQTGDADKLDRAIEAARAAVEALPRDRPEVALYLSNLGSALRSRFERTGGLGDLDAAIYAYACAMDVAGRGPERAIVLSNLGNALRARFERTGASDDLNAAIDAHRQAVQSTPDKDPALAARLNNLAIALTARYNRTDVASDLYEAADLLRSAVAMTPAGHLRFPGRLNNLGAALRVLSERTGDTVALNEAVQFGRQAVDATPADHPDRAGYLDSLGLALQMLFERTGNPAALDEAVQAGRQAVAATPADYPDRARYLGNLGGALRALSERTGEPAVLDEAVDCFRSAAQTISASALVRVTALRQIVTLLGGEPTHTREARAAVESAVALLPQISPLALTRADREHQVGRLGPLAEVAAAIALNDGEPQRAVELLEATRGILIADMLDMRMSDLTWLRAQAPDLALHFEHLRARLESLDQPGTASRHDAEASPALTSDRRLAQERFAIVGEWDALVARIRALEGFSGFLAAPGITELASQASQGPIVFVIAGPTRCDALVLTGTPEYPVRAVSLPKLTRHEAVSRINSLLEARHTATRHTASGAHEESAAHVVAEQVALETLAWLWDAVAEPVLTAIGCTDTPTDGQEWPRIWWCPVGIMAYLPLHAAGHHRDRLDNDPAVAGSPRTVMDRVISSYTPTVRALARARSQAPVTASNTLIIGVPDAPHAGWLPGADKEAHHISTLIPTALRPDNPTRAEVLAALPNHPVVHFACHGVADWRNPAASRLILSDHQTNPLTVADITNLNLTGALAYLSACDTAVTSPRYSDEALHLTGAFHLAGYQNVIGTLWAVEDFFAARVAADFYAALTRNATALPNIADYARTLHHTVRAIRDTYPTQPTRWAAFTHTGI